jgi:hypothetical protein
MPKPNYAFQKRQRELAKKQKKEAKQKAKDAERQPPGGEAPEGEAEQGATPTPPSTPGTQQ